MAVKVRFENKTEISLSKEDGYLRKSIDPPLKNGIPPPLAQLMNLSVLYDSNWVLRPGNNYISFAA